MAQGGQVSIVFKSVLTQPPAAEQRGHEGGDEATYVDEHVEDLETAVAFVFGYTEGFVTLFGGLNLKVVIHLSYDGLQVALEQTVTESDKEQGNASEGQEPADVGGGGQDGDSQDDIA